MTYMTKVEIEDLLFQLDKEEKKLDDDTKTRKMEISSRKCALEAFLKKKFDKPQVGDVFYHKDGTYSPMILAQVANSDGYQLMAYSGVYTYCDTFFSRIHTLEEIQRYLEQIGMEKGPNVLAKIGNLIVGQINELRQARAHAEAYAAKNP